MPSVAGVGTSGPRSKDHSTALFVTSPLPKAFSTSIGFTRVGATTMSPAATGEATMRWNGLLSGLSPSARHSSRPVRGSWPVTTSPPVTTISTCLPRRATVGVV